MMKQVLKRFTSLMLVAVLLFSLAPTFTLTAFAATSGDLAGLSNSDIGASYTATDSGSNSSWSASGNTITGNVISTPGGCGDTAYETTLTLTNKKSTTATLSFDYTIAQNNGTIQVAGDAVTANGSYSGELAAGDSIKVYLKSGSTDAATSISITNLALISDVTATTTFLPGENGSYTVDGVEITAETSKTQSSTVAYTLVAAPASGYQFFGWYSVTGSKYLSSDATATLNFDSDQTIKPVFIDASLAIFETGGARFYDLNEANTYAVANGQDKIVLTSDGTLPSGAYTISSGITLVIPFDSSNAYYTTSPSYTTTAATPMAYRTLTMAPGASIDVQGAISVGAKHYTSSGTNNGNPTGGYGYIKMQEGSSITVKNGGNLYAWGYISGGGHITAESGASVYEYFQITDWRGGSATSSMKDKTQKVFPFSQYYVQNIEASLTLEAGASENVYTSITASSMSASATIHFVGTGAMFELSEGSTFTKTYDPTTDRIVFDVNGDISLNSIALSVLTISVNSNAFVLPINNNVTLNIHSGTTTVNQDVALQPGVQVNIDSGAELKVASGSSVYVYDQDQWGTYCNGGQFKSIAYSPTKAKTRSNADLVDVVIDVNGTLTADGYLYTTEGGADIKTSGGTGKVVLAAGAGTAATTYQATQSSSTITYVDIPITSVKLHNGSQYAGTEEEYTSTDGAAAGDTYVYNADTDMWVKDGEIEEITITFDANGGEGTMEPLTVESGVDAVLSKNAFTAPENFTFAGWNTDKDGNGTDYEDGATVNLTEDTILYAQWERKTVTITFDANGDEGSMNSQTTASGVDTVLNTNTFTRDHYTFKEWNTAKDGTGTAYADGATVNLTEDTTLYAIWTPKTYTVTWVNADGTVLETDANVSYGVMPTYDGATPTKAADAQYTYTFKGWTPEISEVTGNVTYTAVYTTTVNTYTVTWKNDDGTVLETDENVAYGQTPSYDGETPVKAGSAQYSYTFSGWSPAVSEVTGNVTYTAQYTTATNAYTVTWKNYDGTVLETDEAVPYGTTPEYNGAAPTRAADAQYTYTFNGWNIEVSPVTGDTTYTATYSTKVNEYTITWLDENGTQLATTSVAYGTVPTYGGETPVKAGDAQYSYTFAGWDPKVVEVTGPATYKATYTQAVNQYWVTWKNYDGTELKREQVSYGSTPSYTGATPTKEGNAQYSYTFSGWDVEVSPVTCDVTYTAVFTQTLNKYTITWKNDDGTVLERTQVAYGELPGYNGTPAKASDAQYDYTFAGWTPEVTTVTGEATYTATYTENLRAYTVKWVNTDGTVLETDENVPYGTVPTYDGATPTKAADAQYTYSFKGWSPEVSAVTGEAVYMAQYDTTVNTYTVTWVDADNTVLETDENVEYGATPEYNGAEPTKAADAQYTYTFKGWSPEVSSVTGNVTYTAQYATTVNTYTVTWKDEDGTVLETDENVAYGTVPTYDGAEPTKAADAQYTYSFNGWTPEVTGVTGNVTYTAKYASSTRYYSVVWYEASGSDNAIKNVSTVYGGNILELAETYHVNPTKAADAQYTYTFDHWVNRDTGEVITAESTVTGDIKLDPVFKQELRKYTITWLNDDGTRIDTTEVAYGQVPTHANAAKAGGEHYTYTFAGWTPALAEVTGEATYIATFTYSGEKHTVTFDANGGEGSMESQIFEYGVDTKLTNNTFTRTDYAFTGWNTERDGTGATYADGGSIINLTEDITLYAQWKVVNGWYTDEIGTTYLTDGEKTYFSQLAVIGEKTYYFNAEGYLVKDICDVGKDGTIELRAFDHDTGVFLEDTTGVFADSNGDIYWIEDGIAVENKGLVRVVLDNEHIHYYYFGCGVSDCVSETCQGQHGSYKAQRNCDHWAEITNGYLVKWGYTFDEYGVILHDEDTSKNGVCEDNGIKFYYMDGVKVHYGLFIGEDGGYYYAKGDGSLVTGRDYWISASHLNGVTHNGVPVTEGSYTFDADGRIVWPAPAVKNGIVAENGSLYYYEDGKLTYAGLIQIDGSYYYVRTSGEVVHGCSYWITKTNNLMDEGSYTFADDGKMILPEAPKNGIVAENESLYYYEDGKLTYAGLIQIDGSYYYVRTSGEVVHGCSYWITRTNGLLPEGSYTFDDDGRMVNPPTTDPIDPEEPEVKDGIVAEYGSLYYYVDGQLTYAGLIQIDGDYYYVRTSGEVVHGRSYWITKTNGLMPQGSYQFADDGKMILS